MIKVSVLIKGLTCYGVDCVYVLITVSLVSNTILMSLRCQPHVARWIVFLISRAQ